MIWVNMYFQLEVFDDVHIEGLDFSLFEVNQVEFNSTGGAQVPMYIMHKKVLHKQHLMNTILKKVILGTRAEFNFTRHVVRLRWIQHKYSPGIFGSTNRIHAKL